MFSPEGGPRGPLDPVIKVTVAHASEKRFEEFKDVRRTGAGIRGAESPQSKKKMGAIPGRKVHVATELDPQLQARVRLKSFSWIGDVAMRSGGKAWGQDLPLPSRHSKQLTKQGSTSTLHTPVRSHRVDAFSPLQELSGRPSTAPIVSLHQQASRPSSTHSSLGGRRKRRGDGGRKSVRVESDGEGREGEGEGERESRAVQQQTRFWCTL